MASVQLVRRWGSHDAGQSVEVDDQMAAWLYGNHYAEEREGTASAGVLAPGTHGADPRAGGDLSRPGTPRWSRGPRTEGVTEDNPEGNHVNRSARVPGAPKSVGDVSHVAQENLGKEHKDHPGDVLLASGKTLSEEQRERQAELDKSDQGDAPKSAPKAAPTASGEQQGGEKSAPKSNG
jgi:hypothetical protein